MNNTLDLDGPISGTFTPSEIIDLSAKILAKQFDRGTTIASPADMMAFVRSLVSSLPEEVFGVVFLDTRHRVISTEILFRGTIGECSVHARVVARECLVRHAASIVCFHQHPSGIPDPSAADSAITLRLRDALALLDVRLLDHLVVGGEAVISLAQRGLI